MTFYFILNLLHCNIEHKRNSNYSYSGVTAPPVCVCPDEQEACAL